MTVRAMAKAGEKRVITVGGKGSSLSSSSVFEVAHGLSQVRIDSSALARLSSSSSLSSSTANHQQQQPPSSSFTFRFPHPLNHELTPEEIRASALVLLNKLLLLPSSSSSSSASTVAAQLSDALNQGLSFFECATTTDEDLVFLHNCSKAAALHGISALLDYRSSALSTLADPVAALSCEALRADVASAFFFNPIDSYSGGGGDVSSSSHKDEVAVASDLKVLLNGSKLILLGGKQQQLPCHQVSDIPQVHGAFRVFSRLVHSRTRVELNSSTSSTSSEALVAAAGLSSLALALTNLGMSSWRRTNQIIADSLKGNDDLRSALLAIFNKECPGVDSLNALCKSSQASYHEADYIKSFHEIYCLSQQVTKILSWEAAAAFVSLEGTELLEHLCPSSGGNGNVPSASSSSSGDIAKTDNKKKRDKKKMVLGKGTTLLVQFIKDRLQSSTPEPLDDNSSLLLEKWVQDFLSLLDPKDPGFEYLLEKVKEIVDSNESRRLPKLPKGTRDFAKEQMAIRDKAFSIIVDVFKRHGAMALDTPAFELRETLMGKYGEDSKLIYDLADQGGELCSLRYDLTVPFARYVAMNGLTSFKRYQIAKVYRRDNPSKGRYREFYQCDFDIAGQYEPMGPDFEVVTILTELLDELNIGDYEVKLNHRKLLDGMLAICGVPPEKFRTICSSIDKLDKQSFEQIKKEMVDEKGLNVETADKIGTFVKQRGSPLKLLSELKQEGSKFLENSSSVPALNELEILFKALEKARCIDKVVLDLSLARGLDYYTGVIFEAVFKGATQVGSIAAGGRYDNLIGMFGTKQVPAVGVSLGIERVFTIMEQLQRDQNQAIRATETQILVSILGDDLSLAAELVRKCWEAKLKAEYMVNKRVMKHIDRAKDSRIPWMVLVGERELNEGVVKLKDVVANKEEEVPISKFVEELQRRLSCTSP